VTLGWNGDLKKKGLRRKTIHPSLKEKFKMEWRPQKEGIATHHKVFAMLHSFSGDGMETSKRRDCDNHEA